MTRYQFEDVVNSSSPISTILKLSGTITYMSLSASGKVAIKFNPDPLRSVRGGLNLNGADEFKDLKSPVNDLGLDVITTSASDLDFSLVIKFDR